MRMQIADRMDRTIWRRSTASNRLWPSPGEPLRWPTRSTVTQPGKLPDDWRKYSAEMRQSAVLLAQATQTNDHALDARRPPGGSNAACLGCHETFRQTATRLVQSL